MFLSDMITTLQTMKRTATTAGKPPPYLYERFNIFPFHQSPLTLDTYSRLYNALVDGFNRRHHIPKYIFMLPDKDLIDAADFFNFGVSKLLGITLNWLAKQLECLIDIRKEQLSNKRPGALYMVDPKIIWVKMLDRPPVPLNDKRYKTQATRSKFNTILEHLTDWHKDIYVMSINPLHHDRDYDFLGNIKDSGKQQFWRELDHFF